MSHELNTPLTALRGTLEVGLSQERDPQEYQQILNRTLEHIAALSRLVADLLLIARLDQRSRRERFEKVDCSELLEPVIEDLTMIARERGQKLHADIPPGIAVYGDPVLLTRLCGNLIHNAISFSPEGTGSEINVLLTRQGAWVIFTVEDHGIGIAAEDQERIFERFYQADSSRSKGTGLGLPLVKKIVDLHDGRIIVDSKPGIGSTFRVELVATSNLDNSPGSEID